MSGLYSSRAKTPDNTHLYLIVGAIIFGAPMLTLWLCLSELKPDKPLAVDETHRSVKVDRK